MRRLRGGGNAATEKTAPIMRGQHDGSMPLFRHSPARSPDTRRITEMRCAMRSQRITLIVEIALTAALSTVLSVLAVRLPINIAGGTVSFAMLPILVLALRRGVAPAMIAGVLFGFADMLVEPFFVAPVQVALDYPIAFAAVGLAGLGAASYGRMLDRSPAAASATALGFMAIGGAARCAAAWLSGVVFFGANAPAGQPVWLYSLVYNLSYILPSFIICSAAAVIVLPLLERAVPAATHTASAVS